MATVYDKSSLFLAPSGVSNGTVFVQKPVPIYGSEQVTNGDFSQTGAEEVTNGDFATDGIPNTTSWALGWYSPTSNVAIANGKITLSNSALETDSRAYATNGVNSNNILTINKYYKLQYDIVENNGVTNFTYYSGNGVFIPVPSLAVGSYTIYIQNISNSLFLFKNHTADSSISLDNVSVKEVGQDWTLGTGWSIGEDKVVHSGTQSLIGQSNILTIGKTYKITFDLSGADGSNYARLLTSQYPNGSNYTSNGTISVHTITNIDDLYIYGVGDISVTNISVQEVLSPDGDFTFTRGSNLSATRVNEAQLIEKGRENLILQSNQFDTTWDDSSVITLTGGQPDKNGGTSAWELEKGSASSFLYQSITTSGVNTFSLYAKAGTTNWIMLQVSGIASVRTFFDLGNGVLGSSLSNVIDAKIELVGSGWYRCSFSYNGNAGAIRVFPADANNDTSGTSGSVYIQDAQLEQGLVATSVITTGAVPAQAGLLENTPRLDYSGGATCPSLLLEPSRTNLVTQSEYFGSSDWVKQNCIITSNDGISPEGTNNAGTITSSGIFFLYQLATFTSGVEYTLSFYVKSNGSGGDSFRLYAEGNSPTITATSEWVRHKYTFTGQGSVKDFGIRDVGELPIDILIWGAQVEQGSYATSYIPTYGTSQTRAGELYENKNINNFINTANGFSFYYEISNFSQTDSSFSDYFSFKASDSNSPNIRCELRTDGSAGIFATGITGWDTINLSNWTTSGETTQKLLIVITNNSQKAYLNGVEGSDSSAASIVLPTFQQLVTENFFGQAALMKFSVNQAMLFPTALSDLDARILTGATTYETFDEMALALNYTVYE